MACRIKTKVVEFEILENLILYMISYEFMEVITSRMASSGMLHRVALVKTDVSEELSASFIRATRIGELGTPPAVTSNRRTMRRNIKCVGC
jgi:hypothetical protein